jgi:hypothetical protein
MYGTSNNVDEELLELYASGLISRIDNVFNSRRVLSSKVVWDIIWTRTEPKELFKLLSLEFLKGYNDIDSEYEATTT